jgi:hypothetical protein
VFKFRLPVTASKSNDPVSLFIEVVNLTEFSKVKEDVSDNIESLNNKMKDEQQRLELMAKKENDSEISERSNVLKDFDKKSEAKVRVSKF